MAAVFSSGGNILRLGGGAVLAIPGAGTNASVRQSSFNDWPGQPGDPQSLTESIDFSASLGNILAGSALIVVGTLSNGGAHVAAPSISDTTNGSYGSPLQQIDDTGEQQSMFMWLFQNSAAGSAPTLNATFANLEWQGLYWVEVINVPATCLIGSNALNVTNFTSTATDFLTCGTAITGSGQKALVFGFSESTGDADVANGGSGLGHPFAGTGYTTLDQPWNWGGRENTSTAPVMRSEIQFFSSLSSVSPTFTGTGGTDSVADMGLALASN
jgi:hypothetical protein